MPGAAPTVVRAKFSKWVLVEGGGKKNVSISLLWCRNLVLQETVTISLPESHMEGKSLVAGHPQGMSVVMLTAWFGSGKAETWLVFSQRVRQDHKWEKNEP